MRFLKNLIIQNFFLIIFSSYFLWNLNSITKFSLLTFFSVSTTYLDCCVTTLRFLFHIQTFPPKLFCLTNFKKSSTYNSISRYNRISKYNRISTYNRNLRVLQFPVSQINSLSTFCTCHSLTFITCMYLTLPSLLNEEPILVFHLLKMLKFGEMRAFRFKE